MTERLQKIYKCGICGNIVEVLEKGAGELVCCGEPMQLVAAKTQDAATEKHVPYVEKVPGGFKVRVGQNAAHPMLANHWIQWIELVVADKAYRQFLKPGDAPEAVFMVDAGGASPTAREYCNIHGLWKGA